jgi:hypothetical protein
LYNNTPSNAIVNEASHISCGDETDRCF